MPKKIFIHIGSHKTGTTSIQDALASNENKLRANNLSYFHQSPAGKQMPAFNAYPWFEKFPQSLENGHTIIERTKLVSMLSQLPGDVIFSSEHFSFIFMQEELAKFKESLERHFTAIEIIVYLRRQDQHIVSHHNEASKAFGAPASLFFGDETIAMPTYQSHFKFYLDYRQKLSMWAEVFGKENITIRLFDREKMVGGDAVSDFCSLLSLPDLDAGTQSNEAYGLEKAKVGLLMNQAGINNGPLRTTVNMNLCASGKLLPKREEAMSFYDRFRESNIELNKMFDISVEPTIFDDDFSMYSNEANEDWTEDTVNETLVTVFKSLDGAYGHLNYDLMFQAALKLEKTDLKLSYSLIYMLQAIFPNNPVIQHKFNQYAALTKSLGITSSR